jgi:hypothetical protein
MDQGGRSEDEVAVERYRYMLRTAPPETIEQAHAEAFARLTPDQRRMVLEEMSRQLPPSERAPSDDPRDLARMATRAEFRQPGFLERSFGSMGGGGGGFGGGMGGGIGLGGWFLTTMAASFVGTAIAQSFFAGGGFDQGFAQGYDQGYDQGAEGTAGDHTGAVDEGAGDGGFGEGGFGEGGDWGGGDFGGGDLGGRDFGGF